MLGSVYMDTKRMGCIAVLIVFGALLVTSTQFSGFNYCSAVTTWIDNFEDDDISDWTVELGDFSTADGTCRGQEETNALRHDSSCFQGNWSFDTLGSVYVTLLAGVTKDGVATSCYTLHVSRYKIKLLISSGWVSTELANWDPPEAITGWQHFDVTRDVDGRFAIYVNGTEQLAATDTRYMTANYFVFYCYKNGAIDNVVINDDNGGGLPAPPAMPGFPLVAIGLGLLIPITTVLVVRRRKSVKTQ